MRVLAIDPSLRCTGFGILESQGKKLNALAYGTIPNPSSLSQPQCLVRIRAELIEKIQRFSPTAVAIESVIYVQSFKTAIILGAARGAALLAAAEYGLPIYEYAPRRVKQATVGRGGAHKQQVAFMVRAELCLTEMPSPDAADALAVGIHHFRAVEVAHSTGRALEPL